MDRQDLLAAEQKSAAYDEIEYDGNAASKQLI
jgi:hypothetical protein